MKLEKVIEILELNLLEAGLKMPPDTRKALEISVEAVKRIQRRRIESGGRLGPLLPGETSADASP